MQSSVDRAPKLVWSWAGKAYAMAITPWDMLKLAQAVDEEGVPRAGVAWCLLQRAAFLHMTGKVKSLGDMVENYAQPINPDWFPDGARHREEVERLKRIGDFAGSQLEEIKAQKRVEKAAQGWAEIEPQTKQIISGILTNTLPSPVVSAVHYWASHGKDFQANQAAKPELILLDKGYGWTKTNVFFAVRGSLGFGANLRVLNGAYASPGELPPPLVAGPGKGLIAVGLFAGLLAWRWFHHGKTNQH